jgi:3D (Asp-Asp-Asp) domain-containing protein
MKTRIFLLGAAAGTAASFCLHTATHSCAPRKKQLASNHAPAKDNVQVKIPDACQQELFFEKEMRVTAYCPGPCCCGKWADGMTASGHIIQPGDRFVAADKQFAFGTRILIPGYNNNHPVEVLDRGGAIKGDRLDVFFPTHKEALEWGVQVLTVSIYMDSI